MSPMSLFLNSALSRTIQCHDHLRDFFMKRKCSIGKNLYYLREESILHQEQLHRLHKQDIKHEYYLHHLRDEDIQHQERSTILTERIFTVWNSSTHFINYHSRR